MNCLTEEDILNDVLLSEKNMSNSYSVAINEMSSDKLYKKIMNFFDDTKEIAREIFTFMQSNGLYELSSETEEKIEDSCTKYEEKKEELN